MVNKLFPLNLHQACVAKKGKPLIGPVNLTLQATGCTLLLGPNGAGKTTLLRLISGLERLSSGHLNWACNQHTARERMGFVSQQPIMMHRSVMGNLTYPLRLRRAKPKAARAQAEQAAEEIGLTNALSRPALSLSGGEQQKLALARALITTPALLLLDEPSASLDGRATREIEHMISRAITAGTRVLMSSHDLGQARRLADDVVFLVGGRVIQHSAAPSFFEKPGSRQARAYLKGDIVE